MSIAANVVTVLIVLLIVLVGGTLLSRGLGWARLRFVSPVIGFPLALAVSDFEANEDGAALSVIGLLLLTLWVMFRSLHIKLALRGIRHAQEQLSYVWVALYAIYTAYIFHQLQFPYDWIRSHWHWRLHSAAVTAAVAGVSFVILAAFLFLTLGPYRKLRKNLRTPGLIERETLVKELAKRASDKREATAYLNAIVERMLRRGRIVESVHNGIVYISKPKYAGAVPVGAGASDQATAARPPAEGELAEREPLLELFRQNFAGHPAAQAAPQDRIAYVTALFYGLEDLARHRDLLVSLHREYSVLLDLPQEEGEGGAASSMPQAGEAAAAAAVAAAFRTVKRYRPVRVSRYRCRLDTLRYAVYGEFCYTRAKLGGADADGQIADLYAKRLGIRPKLAALIGEFVEALLRGAWKAAQLILNAKFGAAIRGQLAPLIDRSLMNEAHRHLPRHETVVVATMSAGKSTFINALLGRDLMPSRNQACTAKISRVVANDRLGHRIGYVRLDKGDCRYAGVVEPGVVKEWNEMDGAAELRLEGPLAGLKAKGIIHALVDTPGTNYSGDLSHGQITQRYLQQGEYGSVVYLVNATQISTTDDRMLLRRVLDTVKQRQDSPRLLFLLNKADEFDEEADDDLADAMKRLAQDLQEAGIERPQLVPMSAYAAKLFRMAGAGLAMTAKETKDFASLYRLFAEDGLDLTRLALVAGAVPASSDDGAVPVERILVGGKAYEGSAILSALERTGIRLAEACISQMANTQGGMSNG
ncbi:dynamin family protein [Cohnella fermenti]|uniref:Dynamin N-terminal domain-containing protein n=1 Tax=Cohnella fermenti TaxID=2565925 RepID=A0A4V3WES8_9BACL|nr:dynamin family protein [Cohnella fermenti]THF77543.1 hypothetical protein E6C55_16125 [Cohnella fermenti]